jgi:hypothetical protein
MVLVPQVAAVAALVSALRLDPAEDQQIVLAAGREILQELAEVVALSRVVLPVVVVAVLAAAQPRVIAAVQLIVRAVAAAVVEVVAEGEILVVRGLAVLPVVLHLPAALAVALQVKVTAVENPIVYN